MCFSIQCPNTGNEYLRTWTAITLLWASIWFHDSGKTLTSDSPMLLSKTKVLPRWQCFRHICGQWGSLYQEQILYCSQTHSLPNKAEEAAPNCLLPYLWVPMDNFHPSTSQSLTEQSATALSLVVQKATSSKSKALCFSQGDLTNSSSDFQSVSSQNQLFKEIIAKPAIIVK